MGHHRIEKRKDRDQIERRKDRNKKGGKITIKKEERSR